MAFVFRSERNLDFPKDPNLDTDINNDSKISKINSEILAKLKKKEIQHKLNQLSKEQHYKNNITKVKLPPFSSNSEKNTLNVKEETPGPGSYNINNLYFNRHRQFSSREGFSDSIDLDFFNLPSIRLKEPANENPGPGQYNLNEKDLFGGKFKKLYNMKSDSKRRNISSKSAHSIFMKKNNNINNINDVNNNKFDDMKDFILIYSSRTKSDSSNKNKNNDKIKSSYMKKEEPSTYKNNESEIMIMNKLNKNVSHASVATVDTQRSSLNSSNLTLTNPRNASSKILIPKLLNRELRKYFKTGMELDSKKNISLNTIDGEGHKNFSQMVQFKYDKSKIIKSSQDHDRIMLINEEKNNYSKKYNSTNEFILDQEIFSQNPGPGYYNPIEPCNQKYFFKKNYSTMGIESHTKPKILKKASPGPGEYKSDNNSIENTLLAKQNKNIHGNSILFDVKKIAKSRIAKEKESSERNKKIKIYNAIKSQLMITYDNNSKEIAENQKLEYKKKIPKKLSYNFGSNNPRFKVPKKRVPGVGQYDINNYKSIEEKNTNIVENPSYEELMKKLENKSELLERTPLNKDLVNNPAVGEYNPDIITSIKYNDEIKNIAYNQPINQKHGFNKAVEKKVIKKAKEIKEKEKQLISFLGPGKYFNMLYKAFGSNINKFKGIRPAFGSSQNKFENNKQGLYPGPGQYEINSYHNWITRTYNVLFYS